MEELTPTLRTGELKGTVSMRALRSCGDQQKKGI